MANLPFGSSSSPGPVPPIGPQTNPEYTEGAPPGPRTAPETLPVNALGSSTGAPARLSGFKANSAHTPNGPPPPGGLDYPKPAGR